MAIKKFPGFIDMHVHLREPGDTHKEDFLSGSRAAIKGGFTFIVDMPNNRIPTITIERLNEKIALAKKAICDIGFHYGTNGHNTETFATVAPRKEVYGLKIYCNHTTGELLVDDLKLLEAIYRAWPRQKPVLVHAEGEQLETAIGLAYLYNQRLHVCHISQAVEVALVRKAKSKKQSVTAGVCPHHLFLNDNARKTLKGFAIMKPQLGSATDQDALWEGFSDETIDIVETDHAPHTRQEKEGENLPFGVPGLETAVGLLFCAVKERRITEERLLTSLYTYPKKIFNIAEQPDTYVEMDMDKTWVVGKDNYESKAGWSPFDGWELPGVIKKVVLRGKILLDNGKIL